MPQPQPQPPRLHRRLHAYDGLSRLSRFPYAVGIASLWRHIRLPLQRRDGRDGRVGAAVLGVRRGDPSFLATHPNGRFLYAASEIQEFEGQPQGALCAYAIDADAGRLEFINSVGSGGQGPCRVRVDATGRFLLAANYHGGSVCVAPIGDGGGLEPLSCFIQHGWQREGASGVNPARQDKAHAHSINPDADNRFAYVPDLGQDRIVIYRLDAENGTLALADAPYAEAAPGAAPTRPASSRAPPIADTTASPSSPSARRRAG